MQLIGAAAVAENDQIAARLQLPVGQGPALLALAEHQPGEGEAVAAIVIQLDPVGEQALAVGQRGLVGEHHFVDAQRQEDRRLRGDSGRLVRRCFGILPGRRVPPAARCLLGRRSGSGGLRFGGSGRAAGGQGKQHPAQQDQCESLLKRSIHGIISVRIKSYKYHHNILPAFSLSSIGRFLRKIRIEAGGARVYNKEKEGKLSEGGESCEDHLSGRRA